MFLTGRKKSKELVYYEVLEKRAALNRDEQRSLQILKSGFEGEEQFDAVFDEAGHDNLYIFRDIWLVLDGSTVQLDSLAVTDDTLILNEIKNYSGSYTYENGVWKVRRQQISEDPVSQVRRAAGKLVKLSYETGFKFDVKKEVIFINPYFIFESHDGKDADMFVMRSRLKQYMRSLGNYHSGRSAKVLAEEIHNRIVDNPYPVPETEYSRLKLGLNCWGCGGYDLNKNRFSTHCRECGYSEPIERHVVRSALEFAVLFPSEPITKKGVCDLMDSAVSA